MQITIDTIVAGVTIGAVMDWMLGGALLLSPKFRAWVWNKIKLVKKWPKKSNASF